MTDLILPSNSELKDHGGVSSETAALPNAFVLAIYSNHEGRCEDFVMETQTEVIALFDKAIADSKEYFNLTGWEEINDKPYTFIIRMRTDPIHLGAYPSILKDMKEMKSKQMEQKRLAMARAGAIPMSPAELARITGKSRK